MGYVEMGGAHSEHQEVTQKNDEPRDFLLVCQSRSHSTTHAMVAPVSPKAEVFYRVGDRVYTVVAKNCKGLVPK